MKFTPTKNVLLPSTRHLQSAYTSLYALNEDARLIINLMRDEADKLGFIPIPSLLKLINEADSLIWQRDDHGHKIGYLIHSAPKYRSTLHVHLTVVEIDKRRRKHATRAVAQLINKAYKCESPEIRLRCAADLQANLFWQELGFKLIATIPNTTKNQRLINVYELPRNAFKQIAHELIIPNPIKAIGEP